MTRKWGSCSTSGTVSLAADLSEQQTGFQDFVIAHELLHLRVPNHGRIFKALMTVHIPNWRTFDVARRTGQIDRHGAPWRCHSQIGSRISNSRQQLPGKGHRVQTAHTTKTDRSCRHG
jgi:hypothetical protein